MKPTKPAIALTMALFTAAAALAADSAPTNQVEDTIAKLQENREAELLKLAGAEKIGDAIAKLKAASNYSWIATLKIADGDFNPGPVKGQASQDGFAKMSQDFNGNTTEIVLKADNVAVNGQDGWQLLGQGGGMETFFAAGMARNGAAVREAEITLEQAGKLKALDGGRWGAISPAMARPI
jgi:hypothetical protein